MSKQASSGKKEWLGGDGSRLVFLSILYIVQGISLGFMVHALPVIFKNSVLLMLAIQDIAVDGWCVTMVKEENLSNAATAQIIGIRTGSFLSYSLYFALNSVEFCNNYIYFTKQSEPILNESNYLMYGAFFIFAISLYTLIFSNEKNDRIQFEDHHEIFSIIENLKICFKLLQNEQVIILILFFLCETLFCSFQLRFGDIILLNELKYSQEKFSIIQILE